MENTRRKNKGKWKIVAYKNGRRRDKSVVCEKLQADKLPEKHPKKQNKKSSEKQNKKQHSDVDVKDLLLDLWTHNLECEKKQYDEEKHPAAKEAHRKQYEKLKAKIDKGVTDEDVEYMRNCSSYEYLQRKAFEDVEKHKKENLEYMTEMNLPKCESYMSEVKDKTHGLQCDNCKYWYPYAFDEACSKQGWCCCGFLGYNSYSDFAGWFVDGSYGSIINDNGTYEITDPTALDCLKGIDEKKAIEDKKTFLICDRCLILLTMGNKAKQIIDMGLWVDGKETYYKYRRLRGVQEAEDRPNSIWFSG